MPRIVKLDRLEFESNVYIATDGSDCKLWGGVTRNGFGLYYGRLAHEVAWRMSRRWRPAEHYIVHTCESRACVNCKHLRLGKVTEDAGSTRQPSNHLPFGVTRQDNWFIACVYYGKARCELGRFRTVGLAASRVSEFKQEVLGTEPKLSPAEAQKLAGEYRRRELRA